jgi:hypothetical protein
MTSAVSSDHLGGQRGDPVAQVGRLYDLRVGPEHEDLRFGVLDIFEGQPERQPARVVGVARGLDGGPRRRRPERLLELPEGNVANSKNGLERGQTVGRALIELGWRLVPAEIGSPRVRLAARRPDWGC